MKAQKKSVAVAELQKTIRRWRSCKITDSTISKLLELYLGLTAYMNDERVYPVENFYDIKLSLRFATTQALVEAVKQCRSFKFILNDERSRIQAFYSPLWRDEKSENSTECSAAPAAVPQNLPQAFAQTFAADNIYNTNTKGDSSEEELSPSGDEPSDKIPTQKNIVTPDSLAAAKEFFHIINGVPAQKGQMLTPLIDWFQLHEGLTRQHACENLLEEAEFNLVATRSAARAVVKALKAGKTTVDLTGAVKDDSEDTGGGNTPGGGSDGDQGENPLG